MVVVCKGANATLKSPSVGDSYLWSTGETIDTKVIAVQAKQTITLEVTSNSTPNIIPNGSFDLEQDDFLSDFSKFTDLSTEGVYVIGKDASKYHNLFDGTEHTGNLGNFMIINAKKGKIWEKTVAIEPNRKYNFACWAKSIYSNNPGKIALYINDILVGDQLQLSSDINVWSQLLN